MAGSSRAVLAAALALALGATPAAASGRVDSIDRDTVWEGRRVLERTLVVRKGATLTILPGSRVEFRRRDGDGDGIGDTALRVEGRIVARGTPEAPIVFTSAEEDPRPADWMFVILEFSRDSLLEWCRFSYAYSGVQMHYTTAATRNCVFTGNVDGFRFSTANLVVEDNLMEGNVNGIRYEERSSRTVIRGNLIRGNDIGIFCVTASEGSTSFEGNAVVESRKYAVKVGEGQTGDLPMPGNWWGTADAAAIAGAIFDGDDQAGLGRVSFRPFLEVAPAGAWPHIETGAAVPGGEQ